MVQVLYKIFLAVIIALFVGFGINVFYEGPKTPDSSPGDSTYQKEDCLTSAQIQEQKDNEANYKKYEKDNQVYSRNVSVFAIIISVILLIISLTILAKVGLWSDGVLFGGLLTLIYGIIRGMASLDSKFQFAAVTAGLIVVLVVGYIKFVKTGLIHLETKK